MKYVCKICGYVYDEEVQGVPFSELPDDWVCPWCGASKSDFEPQGEPEQAKPAEPAKKDTQTIPEADEDMQKLSAGELSALCSSLARGCEKQYLNEQAALFEKLSSYFGAASPSKGTADISKLEAALQNDLDNGYPGLRASASAEKDRGALRVCTWCEKVTRILKTLLAKYEKEGEAFLENTEVWVCSVCGFVYVGDTPPQLCPVCKVPSWKFDKIQRRAGR